METSILSGLEASKALYSSLESRISHLKDRGIVPGLAAVLVGNNPASEIYVKNKTKKFESSWDIFFAPSPMQSISFFFTIFWPSKLSGRSKCFPPVTEILLIFDSSWTFFMILFKDRWMFFSLLRDL